MFKEEQLSGMDKDVIAGTMRSAVVCLYFLLKIKKNQVSEEIFENNLFKHLDVPLPSSREIGDDNIEPANIAKLQDNLIIENLPEILFEDKFDKFRSDFVEILQQHGNQEEVDCFVERLEMANKLPKESKNQVRGILGDLQHSTGEFFDWLFTNCIQFENIVTRNALLELVFNYLPAVVGPASNPLTPISSSADLDTVYSEQPSVITSRDLCSELFECEVNPQNIEVVNQRIECIQALKSGIVDREELSYIWKFKQQEPTVSMQELNELVSFSSKFPGNSRQDKISCALSEKNNEFINNFKTTKLVKLKYTG
jgi:hypothetical protein